MATVIIEPASAATNLNSRSPRSDLAPSPALSAGVIAFGKMALDRQAMALTAVDNLDLNASGMGT
jgi:hypothetical protein